MSENIKRKCLISILLTSFMLYFTHSIWLIEKVNHIKFAADVFIILLILYFLIIYKLTDYIVDFKTVKKYSRLDIIFLVFFFIILFIPMSHINNDEISQTEKRNLAKFPNYINKDGSLNFKFGTQFEKWYNDRFFLRNNLIALFNMTQVKICFNHYDNAKMFFIKRHNFIGATGIIPSSKYFSNEDVDETAKSINEINKYCKKNNIKFYILLIPHNQIVYQHIVKPFDNPVELKKVNNAIENLQKATDTKIIYPIEELRFASKHDWVYFKTDHHWTDIGAFIAYQVLMDEIKKDFPDLKKVKENDFKIKKSNLVRATFSRNFSPGNQLNGVGFFLLPQKEKILDTKYKYFYHKNRNKLKMEVTNNDDMKSKNTFYPYGADYKVLELGNSMNENLLQFISYTFKNVKYFRLVQGETKMKGDDIDKVMRNYGTEIENYKPDILIYCTTYFRLKNLKYFFEED